MLSKARIVAVLGLAAVSTTALVASSSEAQKYNPPKPITIKMSLKGKHLKFTGPSKVAKGSKITFLNDTSPKEVGPHTASLVDPTLLPKTKAEAKACGKKLEGLCGLIAFNAHKLDPKTFKIGKPDVDVGKKGWDKAFGKKGDSWVAEAEGATESRVVSAKAGTTLTFFCAVHPEMVKKIKVTK